MIIVTSLSPNHSNADNQKYAIESWQKYGECYSINTHKEIDIDYPIAIIETEKTLYSIIGKRLININTMLDFAGDENIILTNSDILIESLPYFKEDGITMLSRYDYTNSFEDGKLFTAGWDMFHIPNKFLNIFPPSVYAMGAAWWDYWIPYRAILAGVPLYWPEGKFLFHKLHKTHYSQEEWVYMGEYFRWEFKINKNITIGQMATSILAKIQSKSIR